MRTKYGTTYNSYLIRDEKTAIIDAGHRAHADLYMQKVNSRWFLVRWEDRISPAEGVNPADPDHRSMGWRRLDSTGSQ